MSNNLSGCGAVHRDQVPAVGRPEPGPRKCEIATTLLETRSRHVGKVRQMTVNQEVSGQVGPGSAGRPDAAPHVGRIVVGIDGLATFDGGLEMGAAGGPPAGGQRACGDGLANSPSLRSQRRLGAEYGPSLDPPNSQASAAAAEAVRLAELAGPSRDAPTTWEAVAGHPGRVLLGAAEDADLLVLGLAWARRIHGDLVGLGGPICRSTCKVPRRCRTGLDPPPRRRGSRNVMNPWGSVTECMPRCVEQNAAIHSRHSHQRCHTSVAPSRSRR